MSDNRESGSISFLNLTINIDFYLILIARLKNLERGQILDDLTRQRRQRKALEALERDNFQDDIATANISDSRLQINKKFQQRFTIENENDNLNRENASTASNSIGQSVELVNSFINEPPGTGTKRKKLKSESRLRFRKNFATLLEEEVFY